MQGSGHQRVYNDERECRSTSSNLSACAFHVLTNGLCGASTPVPAVSFCLNQIFMAWWRRARSTPELQGLGIDVDVVIRHPTKARVSGVMHANSHCASESLFHHEGGAYTRQCESLTYFSSVSFLDFVFFSPFQILSFSHRT